MIQEIEELAAELQPVAFAELHHLEDGAVELRLSVGEQRIGPRVAVSLFLQMIHKSGGIVPPVQRPLAGR